MAVVAERIVDGAILEILQKWLKATVIEEDENGKRRTIGGGKGNRRGTPQGGVISPLLANLTCTYSIASGKDTTSKSAMAHD